MKAAIIAYNHGDLLVFDSVQRAEQYLEPIDVKNAEYVIYDSEGKLLDASVTISPNGIERVVLQPLEEQPRHEPDLRSAVIEFLSQLGKSEDQLKQLTTTELVEESLKFKTE